MESKTMNNDYELLETFQKDNETWSYLRHKKTGLEIAYHQYETQESGFSFTFRTPVEDQYLGTSHVLEHCVLMGSQKYDVSFLDLKNLSCFSNFNAETGSYNTRYFFFSYFEEECMKVIPILADYVFFPRLSEESFMQECIRVEFDAKGDGRKKEAVGVVYNELKAKPDGETFSGGTYYLLQKLTVQRIREYHRKYYRPDNCLFVFNGNAALASVIQVLEKFLPDLEKKFNAEKISPRTNLTVKEFLEKVPFEEVPEHLEDPDLAKWTFQKNDNFCGKIAEYWEDGFSPIMPFCLDEKYAFSSYCWWKKHFKDYEDEMIPAKISVPKIISEYLSRFSPQEYEQKLEKIHEWQARDIREEARKIMEPLTVIQYDIELLAKDKISDSEKQRITSRIDNHFQKNYDLITKTDKTSCSIEFRPSAYLSREFNAEYALTLFLQMFLHKRLRQLGKLYDVGSVYDYPCSFKIFTVNTNHPQKTVKIIKELIRETQNYIFTQTDLLAVKSSIYSIISTNKNPVYYFSEEILTLTPEDLHQAAVRFSHMIEPAKQDETYYYKIGETLKIGR